MDLHHKVPCKACPWRKDSLQGYLGGWEPHNYADAVAEGTVPACHCRDHGPESLDTAFCAGALSVMANACILPTEREDGQEGAQEARAAVGRREDTFQHPAQFYTYHSHGEAYVPRIFRINAAATNEDPNDRR